MTPMLTDADREAMMVIIREEFVDHPHLISVPSEYDTAIYLAGLAAGMERAAKVCEQVARKYYTDEGRHATIYDAAAAIRALASEPKRD